MVLQAIEREAIKASGRPQRIQAIDRRMPEVASISCANQEPVALRLCRSLARADREICGTGVIVEAMNLELFAREARQVPLETWAR